MSSTELHVMHGEHREWQSENALRYDQLREWERDIGEAIGVIPEGPLHRWKMRSII